MYRKTQINYERLKFIIGIIGIILIILLGIYLNDKMNRIYDLYVLETNEDYVVVGKEDKYGIDRYKYEVYYEDIDDKDIKLKVGDKVYLKFIDYDGKFTQITNIVLDNGS